MVTEKDIINMGRKIKRSKNPKTLAKYQIQIDAWIAELETAQAQAQAQARLDQVNEELAQLQPKPILRHSYGYYEFERSHLRRRRL